MPFGIHVLDVEQEQIHIFGNLQQLVGLDVTAGLDGGVDALGLAFHQQIPGGLGLGGAFAAAQRHAAAGHAVKRCVLLHDLQQLGHRLHLAGDLQCRLGADLDALAAAGAVDVPPDFMLARLFRDGVDAHRAGLYAETAVHAGFFLEHDLHLALQAFGVRTPLAAQRAALEKDDRPDAGAIVHIVFLHIEDQSFSFHLASFS